MHAFLSLPRVAIIRRMHSRSILAILLAALPWAGNAAGQGMSCNGGMVFEDANGNGRRDPGEHGLAGIGVSDGLHLVHTDVHGLYAVPGIASGRTVFVIKPPGHGFARRADGLPDSWRQVKSGPGPGRFRNVASSHCSRGDRRRAGGSRA
jgi:hypothetical protein